MGGRQYSEFRLQQERAVRTRLRQQVAELRHSATGYRAEMEREVKRLTDRMRDEIRQEILEAEDWRNQLDKSLLREDPNSIGELERFSTTMNQCVREGQERLRRLLTGCRRSSGKMARGVAVNLLEARSLLAGSRDICRGWAPETVASWDKLFQSADQAYEEGDFRSAEEQIESLTAAIKSEVARSRKLTEKHLSRLELLKAVRQVCCEMGMDETAPPTYEVEGILASRILLRVGNRIVPFNPVSSQDIQREIMESHLRRIKAEIEDRHRGQQYRVQFDDNVAEYLVTRHGARVVKYGGRGSTNVLEDEIMTPMAQQMLDAEDASQTNVTFRCAVDLNRGRIRVVRE